jgi:hypothetical protein
MKFTLIILLAFGSLGVLAEEHNEFTIDCIDKIKNKYQITLNLDVKKFSVSKGEDAISKGSIAQINSSDNSIEFKLLEMDTRDNKKIFTSNGLLGKLVCSV